MFFRLLLACLVLTLPVFSCFAQEIPQKSLEEIRSFPENKLGEWRVGEMTFLADDQTSFAFDHEPSIGTMAEVEFVVRDGKLVATEIEPQSYSARDYNDGPYVFWLDDSTAQVLMIHEGKKRQKVYKDVTKPISIDIPGLENKFLLDPTKPEPTKAIWDAPKKLLAISDLEGQYENTVEFLRNNQVVDEKGAWIWGKGHLVLVGDLVDRGTQVTEVMWLVRRLEREAKKAGGAVHYVLGNHEAMVMAGDTRYVNLKYFVTCNRLETHYSNLFSENSDIGRWWRTKNSLLKIGDLLFVHAGYSPALDQEKLEIDELNNRIRDGLPPNRPFGTTVGTNPGWTS